MRNAGMWLESASLLCREVCGPVMGCSPPLLIGGCLLTDGNEIRHASSVRLSEGAVLGSAER